MTTLRILDAAEKFHDQQATLRPGHSARKARRHLDKVKIIQTAKALLRESKKRKSS